MTTAQPYDQGPGGSHFSLWNASDGTTITEIEIEDSYDINHVQVSRVVSRRARRPLTKATPPSQLIDEDRKAIVSSRMTNAIIKVDVEKAKTEWVCGGDYGQFQVVSIDGEEHSAGSSLWSGQRE